MPTWEISLMAWVNSHKQRGLWSTVYRQWKTDKRI